MALTSQSSRFSAIALSIQSRLSSVCGLDASYVRIAANDNWSVDFSERGLVLRFWGPSPFVDAGAGRRARWAKRLLRVYCYSRSSLDKFSDNSIALFGDLGHSDLEEDVIDALDDWWPRSGLEEGDGWPLTIEPIHPLDSGSGPPERKAEEDVGLVRSALNFEIVYLLPNNTPDSELQF